MLPAVTRGDVFTFPEDDYSYFYGNKGDPFDQGTGSPDVATTFPAPSTSEMWTEEPTQQWELSTDPSVTTEALPATVDWNQDEEQEEACSGKTFDAFTDLKNGSIFAFRGAGLAWVPFIWGLSIAGGGHGGTKGMGVHIGGSAIAARPCREPARTDRRAPASPGMGMDSPWADLRCAHAGSHAGSG